MCPQFLAGAHAAAQALVSPRPLPLQGLLLRLAAVLDALFRPWHGALLYHESAAVLQPGERSWYMRSVRICVLASGSGGNCLWVEAGQTRALFDAGLPLRETRRRCLEAGLPFNELTDVFLTHEHADHCHAAGIIARKLGVRVHATRGTFKALRDPPPPNLRFQIRGAEEVVLGGLRVTPLALPHDAYEPVAY